MSMTPKEKGRVVTPEMEKDWDRYLAAAHAVQSGVAMEMNRDPKPSSPKHLRTGLDTSKADHSGLVKLLIDKGIITEAEYYKAMADAMEAEKARYEAHLSDLLGTKVTLA